MRSTIPLLMLVIASPVRLSAEEPMQVPIEIQISTALGDIRAELDPAKAPLTVANFMRYLEEGFYRGGAFVRTVRSDNQPSSPVKIDVIQAMVHPWRFDEFDPILLERTSDTGLKHLDGALSMARLDPDTATNSFFICVGDQPELDFAGKRNPDGQGFAVFGRVTKGLEVVARINATRAEGQAIMPPVQILDITVVTTSP